MIRLTIRGHDNQCAEWYSDEPTLDSVHATLWGALSVVRDERALVRLWGQQIHDRATFAFFLTRDAQGTWRFADGTPLRGPVPPAALAFTS